MGRKRWDRVAEPSCGLVHFPGPPMLGNVTLCGKTDWINSAPGDGEPTGDPVNCRGCLDVVYFVRVHRAPPEMNDENRA